jgi:adenosylmethionine-8-amino-7-oxononanoate aminotransferase
VVNVCARGVDLSEARAKAYEAITKIDWPEGFQIPSEHKLLEEFSVSRMTVHRALRDLTDEGLLTRATELAPQWEQAMHGLRDCPNVLDIRNIGLIGAIELAPRAGAPGTRAFDAFTRAFHEQDLLTRITGDIIALSPPLIIEPAQIDEIAASLRRVLTTLD